MKGANLDFDDNCRTNRKPASEVSLFLLDCFKIDFEIGELLLFMLNLLTDSEAD